MTRKISAGSAGGATFAGLQGFTTRITSAQDLDISIEPAGTGQFLIGNNAQVQNRNNLQFADTNNTHWVGFRAASTVPADVIWTLPSIDGANNQILTTDSAGTLAWTDKTINISNNTTDTNSNFILFSSSSSGDIALTRVSTTGLAFQPSTGTLSTTRGSISNSLGVGTAPSGTAGEIRATNNVVAFFSSDRKFKENIREIPNAVDKVVGIGGKLFDWTDSYLKEHGGEDGYFIQKEDFGVVAQDVEQHFSLATRRRPDDSLAVDYEKLCALSFAAIAELKKDVEQLFAVINGMKESTNGK